MHGFHFPQSKLSFWGLAFLLFSLAPAFFAQAQVLDQSGKTKASKPSFARPKLVVGIVVDQMSYNFLIKFADYYGNDGFKKLANSGFNFRQAYYNYAPTVTGPGHASIYTGSTPAYHGIAGNYWFVGGKKKQVYCTEDSTTYGVGTADQETGKMSPRNLLSSTIGDELRANVGGRSKVIGIALKDRGAILPAGRSASAAYWFDSEAGNWVTSSYYPGNLPAWVQAFNNQKLADEYKKSIWTPTIQIEKATREVLGRPDTSRFEGEIYRGAGTSLPLNLALANRPNYESVLRSPYGNQLTTDFALECLKAENLGLQAVPDMLCISYSSTDYVGHSSGPSSVECMDTYVKLDAEIARLLQAIEKQVGKGNTLFFLTADHGITENVGLAQSFRMPAGRYSNADLSRYLKQQCLSVGWDTNLIANVMGHHAYQVYLNQERLQNFYPNIDAAEQRIAFWCKQYPSFANAYTYRDLQTAAAHDPFAKMLLLGANPKRSGHIFLLPHIGTMEGGDKGTAHGVPYSPDAHVPLLFYGWGIAVGYSTEKVNITDIAPTICNLLNIAMPSGNIGRVILSGK